jgi:hypothetical protein
MDRESIRPKETAARAEKPRMPRSRFGGVGILWTLLTLLVVGFCGFLGLKDIGRTTKPISQIELGDRTSGRNPLREQVDGDAAESGWMAAAAANKSAHLGNVTGAAQDWTDAVGSAAADLQSDLGGAGVTRATAVATAASNFQVATSILLVGDPAATSYLLFNSSISDLSDSELTALATRSQRLVDNALGGLCGSGNVCRSQRRLQQSARRRLGHAGPGTRRGRHGLHQRSGRCRRGIPDRHGLRRRGPLTFERCCRIRPLRRGGHCGTSARPLPKPTATKSPQAMSSTPVPPGKPSALR